MRKFIIIDYGDRDFRWTPEKEAFIEKRMAMDDGRFDRFIVAQGWSKTRRLEGEA